MQSTPAPRASRHATLGRLRSRRERLGRRTRTRKIPFLEGLMSIQMSWHGARNILSTPAESRHGIRLMQQRKHRSLDSMKSVAIDFKIVLPLVNESACVPRVLFRSFLLALPLGGRLRNRTFGARRDPTRRRGARPVKTSSTTRNRSARDVLVLLKQDPRWVSSSGPTGYRPN